MPPGMTPPLIIRYSASSVPILQLALGSETLPEQQLFDYGMNFMRTQLATVQGALGPPALTAASSGRSWSTSTRSALRQRALARRTSSTAINAQNLILPTGTAKIGAREYSVRLNSSPDAVERPERHADQES